MALGSLTSVALTNTHKFYVAKCHNDTWSNLPPKLSYLESALPLRQTLDISVSFPSPGLLSRPDSHRSQTIKYKCKKINFKLGGVALLMECHDYMRLFI